MNETKQMNVSTLRAFFDEVWNKGDVEACGKYLAKSYAIHHDPGDPWDGMTLDLEQFKNRVKQSRAPFLDQRFDVRELVGEGDTLACSWRWTGTHTGQIAHFMPTGKQVSMSGITFYYFDNARISGHWQVVDRLSVFQQLQRAAQAD